ncbi:MAG: hypothetical protein AB1393_11075 [Candidatus Edwardsbacteria bacterium]
MQELDKQKFKKKTFYAVSAFFLLLVLLLITFLKQARHRLVIIESKYVSSYYTIRKTEEPAKGTNSLEEIWATRNPPRYRYEIFTVCKDCTTKLSFIYDGNHYWEYLPLYNCVIKLDKGLVPSFVFPYSCNLIKTWIREKIIDTLKTIEGKEYYVIEKEWTDNREQKRRVEVLIDKNTLLPDISKGEVYEKEKLLIKKTIEKPSYNLVLPDSLFLLPKNVVIVTKSSMRDLVRLKEPGAIEIIYRKGKITDLFRIIKYKIRQ